MSNETSLTRRGLLMKLGILVNGAAAAMLAVPIVLFFFSDEVVGLLTSIGGDVGAVRWLADNLPEGATIGVLQGVLGNPSLDARVDGMLDTLGDAAEVVGTTPTDCDQTKGLDAAQDLLTANPDLTAIYGACGPPITGALEAIKAADREGDLITVGFDASPDEVAAIVAGTQSASVAHTST